MVAFDVIYNLIQVLLTLAFINILFGSLLVQPIGNELDIKANSYLVCDWCDGVCADCCSDSERRGFSPHR
jgi:hypothetical protein